MNCVRTLKVGCWDSKIVILSFLFPTPYASVHHEYEWYIWNIHFLLSWWVWILLFSGMPMSVYRKQQQSWLGWALPSKYGQTTRIYNAWIGFQWNVYVWPKQGTDLTWFCYGLRFFLFAHKNITLTYLKWIPIGIPLYEELGQPCRWILVKRKNSQWYEQELGQNEEQKWKKNQNEMQNQTSVN